jgi:hypothetical protein
MNEYKSIGDALADLKQRGYEADFDFEKEKFCLYCEDIEVTLDPEEFHVDEVYKFQSYAGAYRNSILFAITSTSGVKGILVDEYNIGPAFTL